MPGKNNPKNKRMRPDTDVARVDRSKNRNPSNISGRNSGEINRGNTIHTDNLQNTSVPNQHAGELHTKSTVTGSDSDGQAE